MRGTISVLAIVGGVLGILGGLGLGVGLGLLAFGGQSQGGSLLQQGTVALAVGLIGLVCGTLLVWAGAGGLSGRADRPFRLPGWAWWLVALVVVLVAGQAAFNNPATFAPLLPFLHLLAGTIAALLFLSLALGAARTYGTAIGARAAVGSLAWGALGGAGIAILVELLLFVVAIVVAALWLSATQPRLLEQLQSWAMNQMQNPGQATDFGPLADVIRSPLVALGILALIGIGVPLIEETTKSLAVPLVWLARGRRLTRLDGFMIGVASGAGFTLLEGILNGSLALTNPGGWAGVMLLRAGTAALHCLAAGLGGLGWQALLVERRTPRGVGLWLAAVAVHGVWNTAAGITAIAAITNPGSGPNIVGTAIQLLVTAFMALAWLGVVLALPLIARRLANGSYPMAPLAIEAALPAPIPYIQGAAWREGDGAEPEVEEERRPIG